MSDKWKLVSEELPIVYRPIDMAFAEHWNHVAGFYAGKDRKRKTQNVKSRSVGKTPKT